MIDFFLPIYVAGFCLFMLLPGWRSLLAVAAAAVLLVGLASMDAASANAPSGVFAMLAVYVFALGTVAGFLGRAVALVFRHRGFKTWVVPVAATLAFSGVPLVIWTLSSIEHARHQALWQPASDACLKRNHDVTMAGFSIAVPLSHVVRVGLGQGYEPTYQFRLPELTKAFCALTEAAVPRVTNITIDFQVSSANNGPQGKLFCSVGPVAPWTRRACSDAGPASDNSVIQVNYYAAKEYDARHLLAVTDETDFNSIRATLADKGRVGRWQEFTSKDNSYWLGYESVSSGKIQSVARCYQINPDKLSFCSMVKTQEGSLRAYFDFRAPDKGFAAKAVQASQEVDDIWTCLRKPDHCAK